MELLHVLLALHASINVTLNLQEMIEDYQMAVSTAESPGRRFRLLVWLSQASEEEVIVNEFGISR